MGEKLDHILESARQFPAITLAVVDAGEKHILKGVLESEQQGLVIPLLIGQVDKIQSVAQNLGASLDDKQIIPANTDIEASQIGVDLVKQNKATALAKGWIHTDTLMHTVLTRLQRVQRVSHVFIAEMPHYPKLLFITDAAININPDLQTKAAIVQNAVDLARLLGVETPKVAALSSVEVVKPAIPSTLDAACLSMMAARKQIKHAIVDGPLAFDNAISKEAAQVKQINSEVSGDVDILLAPNLDAANILAKELEYLANATMAGIVVGTQVPIMLSSRSDPPEARLLSAALAVLMYHQEPV